MQTGFFHLPARLRRVSPLTSLVLLSVNQRKVVPPSGGSESKLVHEDSVSEEAIVISTGSVAFPLRCFASLLSFLKGNFDHRWLLN